VRFTSRLPSPAILPFSLILLLILVAGLLTLKARAATAAVAAALATGSVGAGTFLSPSPDSWGAIVRASGAYLLAVWPALLFGVLIASAVRAFVAPEWLAAALSRGGLRTHVAAGAAGAPLMLCSCCVAPIFQSVYERTSRLGPSLALMLAAPVLNPAALILTFVVFGQQLGVARLIVALAIVFPLTFFLERWAPAGRARAVARLDVARGGFLRSLGHVTLTTVPLLLVAIVASMAWLRWAPLGGGSAVPLVAAAAVPLAFPTFAEIPLALALAAGGAPPGAVVALLVAGPAVNLPSLLTVGQIAGWRTALLVAVGVWAAAVAAGWLVV
jgi:uncharacterized membrane protein YraQ (UPF0718 family)